ncbi:hypothetical protein PTI98_001517 [Pleurotus ostreatus]|nr:hypothetical protein PTI98_001517 [Pleurotus ostreatus]
MPRFQLLPYYLQDALAHFLLPFLMPAPEHCIDAAASDSTSQILPGPSCSAAAPSPSSRSHSPPGGYRTTCVDRSSTFFRSLTAPLASSQHSEPWHEPFLDPSSDYSPDSTRVDLSWTEERDLSVTAGDEHEPAAGPDLPRGYWPSILPKSIYTPHGKWAWAEGKPIDGPKEEAFLSRCSSAYSLTINSGSLGGRDIRYVCKSWAGTQINDKGFFTELALYKCQLKPLQGSVVPSIIGVHSSATGIDVAIEPPHPSFWMEASSDMPNVLKQRCIAAIQRIHDQGVLHGDIQLRHMLIGGNAKVSIVDFDGGRAILPNEAVKVGKASAEDLDKEMKRAMALLKYGGAPDAESIPVFDIPTHEGAGPHRFVMPGQTPAQLQGAIQRFLFLVDGLAEAGSPSDEPTQSRLPPDTDGPKGDTVSHSPPALRERSPEPPPPLQPYQDHVSQEERGLRTYHLRKRKGAPISAAPSPAPKRSRRGVAPCSESNSGASKKECKVLSARASSSKPGRHRHPGLLIPERLLSLDPLTPSPATPSPDPLLLTAPPPSSQPVASGSRLLSPSPPIQSTVLPWSGDPYCQSRGHNNYAQLVALAGQRNIPKFKPGSVSHQNRPSLPQLILDSHDDGVDSGTAPITQSAIAIGKRKRDETPDCPSSEDSTRRAQKVLKWSEAPETNNPSPSKPRRIRSILKKHNPPAIRSIEMSRIAELTDDEDEDIVIQCGVVTVEDVDRINDGSKDLDEELDDDLDMLIDALDSDDNFLNGYPSANLESHELGIDTSSSGEHAASAVVSTVITKIPPIAARDEPTETLLPNLCQAQGKQDLGTAID